MKKVNCIIVDDEEIARLKVVSILRYFSFFNLVGVFSSVNAALFAIEKEQIDVVFLDIDMPNVNGLDLRKKIMAVPICVFITSHPEFAIESFEHETFDYIVKPLRLERFRLTAKRIEEFMEVKHKANLFETSFCDDFIYVKDGYEKVKVKFYDIIYIEALKDYSILVTSTKRYCVFSSIGNLLKEKHFNSFVRIHRSYAVQKQFVEKIKSQSVSLINEINLPIGDSFKTNLIALL